MTNDKTVTMSRELAEQFLAGGRQCDREQLRAILEAPSGVADAEQWYADTPDGDSALVTRVAALCNHPSMSFHQVALLEGAISESAAMGNIAAPVVEPPAPDQLELAALREELATANGCLEEWRRSSHGKTILENMNLQQRLADAEQLLREFDSRYNGFDQLHVKVRAALNPIKVCECPPGVRNITDGGHFPACTACHRRIK